MTSASRGLTNVAVGEREADFTSFGLSDVLVH